MVPASFAITAGLFTFSGLYLYLLCLRRARSGFLSVLSLPLFILLFVAGPVTGCDWVALFVLEDSARPLIQTLADWMLLTWMITVALCLYFDRCRLQAWLNDAAGIKLPQAVGTAPATRRIDYIPALDGLRGVAILEVFASHFTPWVGGGYYGVSIFFVLSGYIITTLFLKEFADTNTISLPLFYRRRALRLLPALVAMLATFCLASFFVSAKQGWISCRLVLLPLFFLANWDWAFNIFLPRTISPTWSLSVEEQFYLCWPLLLWLMLRVFPNRRGVMALIAIDIGCMSLLLRAILFALGTEPHRLYVRSDTRADGLMAGCALALALSVTPMTEERKRRLRGWLRYLTPVIVIGLVAASSTGKIDGASTFYWGFLLVHLCAVTLILGITVEQPGFVRDFLTMRWLVWVGSISYGLYLWHSLVLLKIEGLIFSRPAVIMASVLLPLFIATVSHYCVEKPFVMRKSLTPRPK